jgi:hypothetical protein
MLFSGSERYRDKFVNISRWKLTPFPTCVIIFSPADVIVGGLFVV